MCRGQNFLPHPSQLSFYPCDRFLFCYFLPYLDRLIPPSTVSMSIYFQYRPTGPLTHLFLFLSFFFSPSYFLFFSNQSFFCQPILILIHIWGFLDTSGSYFSHFPSGSPCPHGPLHVPQYCGLPSIFVIPFTQSVAELLKTIFCIYISFCSLSSLSYLITRSE